MTVTPTTCLSCMDKGWRMIDRTPSACHCDAGRDWSKRAYPGDGPWEGPRNLPPGGDVLAAQAKREAAGIPVGAVQGAPIRALLVDDTLVQSALEHVAALASELAEDVPARVAAVEWVEGLPEHYRVTVPPIRKPPARKKSAGGRGAMPLAPPPPQ